MADNLTRKQRSYTMSRIRSKWTKQEKAVHNILKALGMKHTMHPKIDGSPDVILPDSKTAVFINGCFWHKCPLHYKPPKSNRKYWIPKIENNVLRDKKNIRLLRKAGWKVIVVWEHDLN